LSQADDIWVAYFAEQMTGMETRRRKTGNQWVSPKTRGEEREDASETCAWQASRQTYEHRCAA